MKTKIVTIALILLAPWAGAITVSLQGPASVAAGQQFEVAIIGDFGEFSLKAGGVQILFDSGLASVDGYGFALPVDPILSCPGSCPDDPPGIFSIAWGELGMTLIPPNAGPTLMGTLTMTAIEPVAGVSPLVLSLIDWDGFTGGWFDSVFSPIPTPEYFGTTIEIRPVPLPAAAWLLLSTLGALGGLLRHRGK